MVTVAALALGVVVPASVGGASGVTGASNDTKGTVKVGQILNATNSAGGVAFPTIKKVMEAAVKGFNKRGGVNGMKLELELCDSKGEPNTEAECARQLVDEGVVATLGDWSAFNPEATSKILEEAGIPRIGINLVDPSEFSSPVSFPLSSDPVGGGTAEVVGLIQDGHEKVAVVIAEAPSAPVIVSLVEPAATAAGGEIVTLVQVAPGADYSQYVAAAKKDGATAFALGLDGPSAIQFMTAMQQLNDTTPLALPGASLSLDDLKEFSSLTKKAIIADGFPAVSSNPKQFPFLKDFRKDMKAAGIDLDSLDGSGVGAWGSMLAFVTIMDGAPTVDAASTLAALKSAQNVDLQGLIAPWTPGWPPSPYPLLAAATNPYVYLMTFNGKAVKTETPGIDVLAMLNAGG
jgi:ABC-type branched-subunit amino acid transport system substrate-binding protein